jgi:hypothetical protein
MTTQILDYFLKASNQRILENLEWIVRDSVARDTVFVSFSGHGTGANDTNGDERDG